jgi:hypothetical protein
LHIGESRDSGFDASHRPGMTVSELHRTAFAPTRWLALTIFKSSACRKTFGPESS